MDEIKAITELPDDSYPNLSDKQIARLSRFGARRSLPAGELLSIKGQLAVISM